MITSQKINDCKSLESSQENVYGRVYFSKVASLQCGQTATLL